MSAVPSSNLQTDPSIAGRRAKPSSHIPALDGIRGLAVLLVFYCHTTVIRDPSGAIGKAFMASARLSWSGVDLFFVLSGFLITGILFDAKQDQNFFRNFYARRTVRIFPLYYAFLVFALLIVPNVSLLLRTFAPAPPQQIWYWLYISNFYQALQHATLNYANDIVHVSWTLAIEEQFYLCWPLAVFLLNRKRAMQACLIGFFGSLILRSALVVAGVHENVIGGFTPCRLDGLLAGAWVALLIRNSYTNETGGWTTRALDTLRAPAKLMGIGSAILLAAIVVGSFVSGWRGGIGQSPAYNIAGFSVLATGYASVLVLAVTARPGGFWYRIFTGKFLTVFGKYSYAVYLLHWPLTIVVRDNLFDPRTATSNTGLMIRQLIFYAILGPLALLVAWISWNVFEKHFLALKKFFPTSHAKRVELLTNA